LNGDLLPTAVENQVLDVRFVVNCYRSAQSFTRSFPRAPMPAHSHKRPNPAELFVPTKSDISTIELTPSEALTAISVLAVAADGQISEEERQTLAANHIRLFSSYSGEHFQELFKKVLNLSRDYNPAEVFAAAKNTLTPQLRETIRDKLRMCGSCQGDLRRGWKKNWSEPRCCSGKGAMN
jgi:hypothetical protein